MAKLIKNPILIFKEGIEPKSVIVIPEQAVFLTVKLLSDGIYVFHAVTDNPNSKSKSEEYKVVNTPELPDDKYDFIDILDVAVEVNGKQDTMIFPIYKLK